MKSKLTCIPVLCLLLFCINIHAQTTYSEKDSISQFPVWKQIRRQYGLPITRQKHKPFKESKYARWEENRKHHFALLLSLPYINWYNLSPERAIQNDRSFGCIGLGVGLEYFHSKNTSLSLKWNETLTFLAPVPAPVDYGSYHTHVQGMDLNVMHNHYIRYLSIGYGVCIARNEWIYHAEGYEDTESSDDYYGDKDLNIQNYTLGIPIHIYGNFCKSFGVGINYRPTFYRIHSPQPWKYEHLVSIDFLFRISLYRNRKNNASIL